MKKTKVIATIGPACREPEIIQEMIDSGVDVFRINFSHSTMEQHASSLKTIREVMSQNKKTTALLGDLCGPKIRTSRIVPEGQILHAGEEISIMPGDDVGIPGRFGTNYEFFNKDVKVGHRIFIDDGNIALRVVRQEDEVLVCEVIFGGPLHSRKGINLPDTDVSLPSITEQDWQYVDWSIENNIDFLALSFVRSAKDIIELRAHLDKSGSHIKIIAKIETPQALNDLEEIVLVSDVILVARGDLGVEMDLAEVPLIQKRITEMCHQYDKPVVIATQMLQSMINNPVATRAEVSDVANAIMDLTDAVMLSGETSVGKYPVHSVQAIERIALATESCLDKNEVVHRRGSVSDELVLTAAMAHSVGQIVTDIDARLVVVWSESGSSARLLSKARIKAPILALSSDLRATRQMCLHYGVIAFCQPVPKDIEAYTNTVDQYIVENKLAEVGDAIVLVAGQPLGAAGTTNAIMVHTVTAV